MASNCHTCVLRAPRGPQGVRASQAAPPMSARMLAVLRCDHDGCDRRFVWSDNSTTWKPPRIGDARAAARRMMACRGMRRIRRLRSS